MSVASFFMENIVKCNSNSLNGWL